MSNRSCAVEGCDKPFHSKQWCNMHYARWRAHGDPGPAGKLREPGQLCQVDGCTSKVNSNGLCLTHYIKSRDPRKVAAKNAQQTIRKGGWPTNQRRSPFNLLVRSCPSCGDQLTTPWVSIVRGPGVRVPGCRPCGVRRTMEGQRRRAAVDEAFAKKQRQRTERLRKRMNDATLDKARNSRKEWTGPEIELAARSDLSASEVAYMIGRTLYAVKHMRARLRSNPREQTLAGHEPQVRVQQWPTRALVTAPSGSHEDGNTT